MTHCPNHFMRNSLNQPALPNFDEFKERSEVGPSINVRKPEDISKRAHHLPVRGDELFPEAAGTTIDIARRI